MIKHIVLLTIRKDVSQDKLTTAFAALSELRKFIPEIQSFSWGEYRSNEGLNQGFTHGFEMEFNSEKSRDAYLEHPAHKEIASSMLVPLLENGFKSVIAFDYEV